MYISICRPAIENKEDRRLLVGEGTGKAKKSRVFKLVSWLQLIYPSGFLANGGGQVGERKCIN